MSFWLVLNLIELNFRSDWKNVTLNLYGRSALGHKIYKHNAIEKRKNSRNRFWVQYGISWCTYLFSSLNMWTIGLSCKIWFISVYGYNTSASGVK